jgi:hypothetical protein
MRRSTRAAICCATMFSIALTGCAPAELDEDLEEEVNLNVTAEDEIEDTVFQQMADEGKEDGPLTYQAVARLAKNAGVPCDGDRIPLAVAVARAESSFRPWITNTIGNARGIDRGLWQFNSYWHPEVSASCAFSPSCSARAMKRVSRSGSRWREWWTWLNGKHLQYMASSRTAKAAVCP